MGQDTKIEWAHHTFNPWIGCTKVSPACDHCYAEAGFATRRKVVQWGAGQPRKHTAPSTWAMPIKWNAEAERLGVQHQVFCASLADVFDNEVPAQWRVELFNLILSTPHLDWLLLTKRIGNAARMIEETLPDNMKALPSDHPLAWPWPNVWIGASITSQAEADRDIPKLLAVPAAKRFLSMEPLLGPVTLREVRSDMCEIDALTGDHGVLRPLRGRSEAKVDWVIVGGESGPNARPMHPDWARSLRDQCQAAGVPFLFKQWGEWAPATQTDMGPPEHTFSTDKRIDIGCGRTLPFGVTVRRVGKKAAGRLLDGREWNEVPA